MLGKWYLGKCWLSNFNLNINSNKQWQKIFLFFQFSPSSTDIINSCISTCFKELRDPLRQMLTLIVRKKKYLVLVFLCEMPQPIVKYKPSYLTLQSFGRTLRLRHYERADPVKPMGKLQLDVLTPTFCEVMCFISIIFQKILLSPNLSLLSPALNLYPSN